MPTSSEWEQFFDQAADSYRKWMFTHHTEAEAAFLVEELAQPRGSSILDIGCGTGRHAIELARLGYHVTGVDLSSRMLEHARGAAEVAGVNIELIHADATTYTPDRRFDAAICLCEGAFTLIGAGDDAWEHDLAILRVVRDALRPGGRFVLTALNGLRSIRRATPDDVSAGRFDPLAMVETGPIEIAPAGPMFDASLRQRSYVPTELMLMLKLAGLRVDHVWGGTAGNWGRRPVDLDEVEIMITATKP